MRNKMFFLIFLINIVVQSLAQEEVNVPGPGFLPVKEFGWPYVNDQRFNYSTDGPIDIDSKASREVAQTPLEVYIDEGETVTLRNTGKSLYCLFPSDTASCMLGGVLHKNEEQAQQTPYIFKMIRYIWNSRGRNSSYLIDHKGAPLTVEIVAYRKEYLTFDNATRYFNGIAILSTGVFTGSLSTKFIYFGSRLNKVQKPGKSIRIQARVALWCEPLLQKKHKFYYAYASSFNNFETGEKRDCAIEMDLPLNKRVPEISDRQFNKFRKLLDTDCEPYDTALPIFEAGNRQVVNAGPVQVNNDDD